MASRAYNDLKRFFVTITPYAKSIVLFFIPIYLAVGTVFAKASMWVVDLIPTSDLTNFTGAYIVGAVIIIIGFVVGLKTDPELIRKKELEESEEFEVLKITTLEK